MCVAPLTIEDVVLQSAAVGEAPHPGGQACLTVSCPGDRTLLGGGFFVNQVRLDSADFLDPQDWEVCGPGVTGESTWNAHAMCASVTGDVLHLTTEDPMTILSGTTECVEIPCPKPAVVLGGGATWGPDLQIHSARPTGGTYRVCGTAVDADVDVRLNVACGVLADGGNVHVVEGSSVATAGSTVCATSACPGGEIIIGSGGSVLPGILMTASHRELGPLVEEARTCGAAPPTFGGEVVAYALCYSP